MHEATQAKETHSALETLPNIYGFTSLYLRYLSRAGLSLGRILLLSAVKAPLAQDQRGKREQYRRHAAHDKPVRPGVSVAPAVALLVRVGIRVLGSGAGLGLGSGLGLGLGLGRRPVRWAIPRGTRWPGRTLHRRRLPLQTGPRASAPTPCGPPALPSTPTCADLELVLTTDRRTTDRRTTQWYPGAQESKEDTGIAGTTEPAAEGRGTVGAASAPCTEDRRPKSGHT
eukprot:scaffold66090_cov78-Phaeocystis_antarctica.AAC.6